MRKLTEVDKQIDEYKKNVEILSTGFPIIDLELEGGFLKKELIMLGGKTGGGKSLLAGSLFLNMAKQGYRCAYFSLEIQNEMVVSRLIGAQANLSPTRVMIAQLTEQEQSLKNEAKADLAVYEEFMYFYDDVYEFPKLVKEITDGKYDFVVVDFIQNILMSGDEYEKLSRIAVTLQKLAKSANCCMLVLSQLSNQMARDKKNDIVEYKGSGAIGHAADLGFFIEDGMSKERDYFSLRLRKNRRGPSGMLFNFVIKYPGGKVVAI